MIEPVVIYPEIDIDVKTSAEIEADIRTNAVEYSGSGIEYIIEPGSGLKLNGRKLSVETADRAEEDNTLPITSAAVYVEIGNISAILEQI